MNDPTVDRRIVEWVLSTLEEATAIGETDPDGALTWLLLRLRTLMPDSAAR